MAVKPSDILRGKYRIDALIGRGGMGQVFSATDLSTLDRTQVAIKIVSRLLVDGVMMLRLQREAEAALRIKSDYVPRVLEVSDTEEGETFLVMDRLFGESLAQRIREEGALPWPEVAKIGDDVLCGLVDAHAAGVIHRDLKPSNVFLSVKFGQVRAMVLDFGVCKLDGVDVERLTGTGESIGTVAYMAPEQIRGASKVDGRADVYAFGALVFEMLSGRLPHEGPSQMAILASKLEKTASTLQDASRVAFPEALEAVVARALARDPENRFESASELLVAWRSLSGANVQPSLPPAPSSARAIADEITRVGEPPTEIIPPPLFVAAEEQEGPPPSPPAAVVAIVHLSPSARRNEAPSPDPPLVDAPDTEPELASVKSGSTPDVEPQEAPRDEVRVTQTALAGSLAPRRIPARREGLGPARIAMLAAFFGVIASLVLVAFSFSRPDPPTIRASVSFEPVPSEPVDPASVNPLASTGVADPSSSASATPSVKVRLLRPRPARPGPAPARSVIPKITSQPRY